MKGSLCRLAETSFLWRDTAMRIRERFNPRAPCGARLPPRQAPSSMPYFNPCAPCGARRRRFARRSRRSRISTHAPLAGRDTSSRTRGARQSKFQPTRPLRGATNFILMKGWSFYISTHAPLAGATRGSRRGLISTHAPLAGRDARAGPGQRQLNFNPRAPCGARRALR